MEVYHPYPLVENLKFLVERIRKFQNPNASIHFLITHTNLIGKKHHQRKIY